jgi:transposase
MRADSTDLKERLVRAVANGQPLRAAARRFDVAVTTVKRAVVRQRETGSLERKPIPGRPRAIGREQEALLRARLAAAPEATVLEHCAWWAEHQGQPVGGTSGSAGGRGHHVAGAASPRLDASKQSLAAGERDEAARAAWRDAVAQLDPEQLVFVDESGTHIALTRPYGRAPHDRRAVGSAPRNHGPNTPLVAALTPGGLQEPWMLERAMDAASFEWDSAEQLGPTLRPGQVVVLDNLSVHKAARIRQALAARGCELLFLPPYSPDCTPIEQAFSKLKAILRGLGARTHEAFVEAMHLAVEAITPADAIAWFAHAGYALPDQGN